MDAMDAVDVLEVVMKDARNNLKEYHARVVAHADDVKRIHAGHALTDRRRAVIYKDFEKWEAFRRWFTEDDGTGQVTLRHVCDAAGTTVGMVRAHYQEFLVVPFNFQAAKVGLWWLIRVREECGICIGRRCEEKQTVVHDEGRAAR